MQRNARTTPAALKQPGCCILYVRLSRLTRLRLDAQQPAGLVVTGSPEAGFVVAVVTVRTGRDARQAHEVPQAESRPRDGVFFLDRMEVFFAVQAAVFAHRVLQHEGA